MVLGWKAAMGSMESSAYAKITGVAHVVADWWHPVASQGSFTKPDFIGKDCSAVNFF
jgi:hypothetical protein